MYANKAKDIKIPIIIPVKSPLMFRLVNDNL